MATLVNDVIAGLDTSVMAEVSGAQLMQQVQELVLNDDRAIIFCKDDLPTVAEITAHTAWKRYLAIKSSDNPKVIYGFDLTKFNALTDPPWTPTSLAAGSITNAQLAGGIQLSKLSINPAVPTDAGKFVVVNGSGTGYIHVAFGITDGSITIAKLSIDGGIEGQLIRIKEDLSGYEFIDPDDVASAFSLRAVALTKLDSGGANAGPTAKFAKVAVGSSLFGLGTVVAADISAPAIPDNYVLQSLNQIGVWVPKIATGGYYAVIRHTEIQGTNLGNAPGIDVWFTRTLNDKLDSAGIITDLGVTPNTFKLAPGTYRVKLRVPGLQVNQTACRLWNITAAAEQTGVISESAYAQNNAGVHFAQAFGEFTLAVLSEFRVEQIVKLVGTSNGLGIAGNFAGRNETYTTVEVWKVA